MQPVTIKITQTSEYKRIKAIASKVYSQSLMLQYAPGQEGVVARYGITTTKQLGNAVVRNKTRRRLNSLLRELLPLQGKPGWDYVIIARHAAAKVEFAELKRDLRYILSKAGKDAAAH